VDGSRVIGTPAVTSLAVQTAYAKMDIPLDRIARITIGAKPEQAMFTMKNGDQVRGAMLFKTLELQTALGRLAIQAEHIAGLTVRAEGTEHLLLWNKLGSEQEVLNSEVGAKGVIEGEVQYAPGKGVALQTGNSLVKYDRPFGAEFPEAGCLEFRWIPAHDEDSSTGSHNAERNPFILSSEQRRAGGCPFMEIFIMYRTWAPGYANRTVVYFVMYDEGSAHDLAGIVCAYDLNFTAGQPMHLALSWNKEWGRHGLKLFKNGAEMPLACAKKLFKDGTEEPYTNTDGADIGPIIDTIRRRLPGLNYDLALLRRPRRPDGAAQEFDAGMSLGDLKIWDYSKTNFTDWASEKTVPR
jgi:hypothetical protein